MPTGAVYAGFYQRRKKHHYDRQSGNRENAHGYRTWNKGLWTGLSCPVYNNSLSGNRTKKSNSKQKLRTYQKRFEKYDLIIADELGYISFDREAADLLFTVLSLRASQKSTIITSNLTFERWDEIFGDAAITSAIVDRLTYKAYLIDMEGDSYRLRETLRNNGTDFETVVK